jgi:hypothetical protein
VLLQRGKWHFRAGWLSFGLLYVILTENFRVALSIFSELIEIDQLNRPRRLFLLRSARSQVQEIYERIVTKKLQSAAS